MRISDLLKSPIFVIPTEHGFLCDEESYPLCSLHSAVKSPHKSVRDDGLEMLVKALPVVVFGR